MLLQAYLDITMASLRRIHGESELLTDQTDI